MNCNLLYPWKLDKSNRVSALNSSCREFDSHGKVCYSGPVSVYVSRRNAYTGLSHLIFYRFTYDFSVGNLLISKTIENVFGARWNFYLQYILQKLGKFNKYLSVNDFKNPFVLLSKSY